MLQWISKCWAPIANQFPVTYLLLDACQTHLTKKGSEALVALNMEWDLIPAGYTSKLQPMDVGINKPFKNYIRRAFDKWLVATQGLQKPKRKDVSSWIWEAWDNVSEEILFNLFKGSGYYNADKNGGWVGSENDESDDESLVSKSSDPVILN